MMARRKRLACRRGPRLRHGAPAGVWLATVNAWRIAPSWNSRKSWQSYLQYSAKFQPVAILEQLYPNADHARIYASEMEKMGYNVFAEKHVDPRQLSIGSARPDFRIELVNGHRAFGAEPFTITEKGAIEISGWAYNLEGTAPARAIFITVDGTMDLPGHMGPTAPTGAGHSQPAPLVRVEASLALRAPARRTHAGAEDRAEDGTQVPPSRSPRCPPVRACADFSAADPDPPGLLLLFALTTR